MLGLYYPPFRADDDVELLDLAVTGIRAYVEDLSEFSGDTLSAGWRTCRRDHRTERWPTIGAIREACLAAQPAPAPRASVQRQDRKSLDKYPFPVLANDFLLTPRGQWGLRNGCGLAAWERVAETGRDLTRDEMKQVHDSVQRNHAALSGEVVGLRASLARFWEARMKREAALAEQYLGQDAA